MWGFPMFVYNLNKPEPPQTIQTPTAGFVVFWWTRYYIAQTGILYMGRVSQFQLVLLHGVWFWRIQEGS